MGDLRKDLTKKGTHGRKDGLTLKGKVRQQDTGKAFGRGKVTKRPVRGLGKGI